MLKKLNHFNFLLVACLLVGCAGTASEVKPETLDCTSLTTRVNATKEKLLIVENDIANYSGIDSIRTNGGVGVSGGSSSGVNLGVGVSLGGGFDSYRHRKNRIKAEELRQSLTNLENLATEKECITS